MPKGNSDLIDIECQILSEREKAIAIWDGVSYGDGLTDPKTGEVEQRKIWIWLPLSQIEIAERKKNGIATITMPEWLALEKELI